MLSIKLNLQHFSPYDGPNSSRQVCVDFVYDYFSVSVIC